MLPRLRRMDLWLFTRKSFRRGQNTPSGDHRRARAPATSSTPSALMEASLTTAGEALAAIVERAAAGRAGR